MIDPKSVITFNPPERSRMYFYPTQFGMYHIKFDQVEELIVSTNGNHRLKTADGKRHIMPAGWLHIELDIDNWSV